MRTGGWMWGALAVVICVSMYLVKYKVQALEEELMAKREQISRDRGSIRVLEAEWTYLNDPGRLRRLSSQYLGFRPAVPQNVMDVSALPMREKPRDGAPVDGTLTDIKPLPASGPVTHAANEPETSPFAPRRSVGLPVLVARLQRLLFPEAVGATTAKETMR